MRNMRQVAMVVAGFLAVGAWAEESKPMLLQNGFEENPMLQGWCNSGYGGAGQWAAVSEKPGGHSLLCTSDVNMWFSPAFEVKPFECYQYRFSSKAEDLGYVAVFFYAENGDFIIADDGVSIDPSKDWVRNTLCFTPAFGAKYAMLVFFSQRRKPVYVDDVAVVPVTHAETAAWADSVYAGMPAYDFVFPSERWQYLSKTRKALQDGQTIRVVMLGDSIVNDTANSQWNTLVERRYPKARLEVVRSILGSTGCFFYKDQNRVKPFVLDFHPRLLIIGGVSNLFGRSPAEAVADIRSVIQQVRAATDCEILVMTGAVDGRAYNPERMKDWSPTVDPNGTGYRSLLSKMAAEEKVAYLDMTGAWGQYVLAAKKPYDWYLRDLPQIHGNVRGKQVLGRIMDAYFAP